MATKILLTLDDLETAVPLNAALEAAGFRTATLSTLDNAAQVVRREAPALIIVTGAVYEPRTAHLAALAHDAEISTLALLEPTDSQRQDRTGRPRMTEVMTKPVRVDDVVAAARRVIDRRELQEHTGIIGESPPIQEVLVKIEQMAPVSSTVLILGESGSGKELVAKAMHDLSPRRGKPFIAVNCSALPETLLESELFGHEKGAFTGAAERRLGRFELAHHGTIFLDEIGEIPASVQVKLLRVLENRTFYRLGGTESIKVDVRVVAATNKSLKDSVSLGEFRDDLYYRLNVLTIDLPPLRERRGDIPLLVRRFIKELSKTHERHFRGITPRRCSAWWRPTGRATSASSGTWSSPWWCWPRAPKSAPPTSRPTSSRDPTPSCRFGSILRAARSAPRNSSSSSVVSWSYGCRSGTCNAVLTSARSGFRSSIWAMTPWWPTCCPWSPTGPKR